MYYINTDNYGRITLSKRSPSNGFPLASSPQGALAFSNPYGYQQLFSGGL
jgi:hypothetical protein